MSGVRFARRHVLPLVVVLVFVPSRALSRPPLLENRSRDALVRTIDTALSAPALRGGVQGIIVETLDTGERWYERNGDLLLMPASNQKLITTAAALCLLGEEFRYRTTVLACPTRLANGIVRGDLVLVGSGDPFLDEDGLDDLVSQIKARGIRGVEGRVVGDASCFAFPYYGDGWSWDDMSYYYSAPVSGLNLNRNVVQVVVRPANRAGRRADVQVSPTRAGLQIINDTRTVSGTAGGSLTVERDLGSHRVRVQGTVPQLPAGQPPSQVRVTVPDPPLYAATRLREKLRVAGIAVAGRAAVGSPERRKLATIAEHIGPPLPEVLRLVNKPSDNLGAECLLRTIGLARKNSGSAASGREAVVEWLRSIGAPDGGLVMRDGSGLSRMNFVTAETVRAVLRAMATRTDFEVWLSTLPVAGVDGTLRNRLRQTAAEGNCRAKTGYIANVSSLSGYVTTRSGRRLLFVILMNNHACRNPDAMQVQDTIIRALAEYAGE